MKFICIADEDTVRGFRLAGVAGEAVTNAREAAAALGRAVLQPDCGILILTERVAAGIRPQVEAIRSERDQPLLVVIPGPEGPLPGHRSLRQLVQEAVGIRVDQKGGA
jgi:V/A-type H+/Na+-transporting ATPase subunit F